MNKFIMSKESGLPGVCDLAKFSINSFGRGESPRISKEALGLWKTASNMYPGDMTPLGKDSKLTPFVTKALD